MTSMNVPLAHGEGRRCSQRHVLDRLDPSTAVQPQLIVVEQQLGIAAPGSPVPHDRDIDELELDLLELVRPLVERAQE